MAYLSLAEIQAEVDRLAGRIGAKGDMLPTYGRSRDFGYPHIEVDGRGYHYVIVERGEEMERRTSTDIDDLLFWIFEGVASELAQRYEVAHRNERQDVRRIMFDRKAEILGVLSTAWSDRERRRQAEILKRHPFDDHSLLRAIFSGKLIRRGHAPEAAQTQAYEKYPEPDKS